MMKSGLFVIACFCLVPTVTSAQQRKESITLQLSEYRVSFTDGTQKTGRGVLEDSTLLLRGNRILLSDVVQVEQSHIIADPLTNGALVGAAVTISLGSLATLQYGHLQRQEDIGIVRQILQVVGGGVIGAFLGMGVDGAIGTRKEWRVIWPDSP